MKQVFKLLLACAVGVLPMSVGVQMIPKRQRFGK